MSDFYQPVTLGRWEVLIPVRDNTFILQSPDERDVGCCRAAQQPPPHTPTHPCKLLSCFWEQRPSERSAGHLPIPSSSYCFLLLSWQRNRTANLISICFIWSLAYFICQSAYPNYYWAPGSGHSKLCQEKANVSTLLTDSTGISDVAPYLCLTSSATQFRPAHVSWLLCQITLWKHLLIHPWSRFCMLRLQL